MDRTQKQWEARKKEVQAMSEKEFTAMVREMWNKYQASIEDADDSIDFVEYYDEACADYGRTPKYDN